MTTDMDRRHLLRMAAPAVALPMVAAAPALAKEMRLVTRDEIMDAFRFYDNMELRAEDLNLRYQILIDMLFETNPENLRAKLQALIDARRGRPVLLDPDTGEIGLYDPDSPTGVAEWSEPEHALPKLPKPWRFRLAAWVMGWRV